MSRIDELARHTSITMIIDDLQAKLAPLKGELRKIRLDFLAVHCDDPHKEEKYTLIQSRADSVNEEVELLGSEIKYRRATAKWIKDNLPRK